MIVSSVPLSRTMVPQPKRRHAGRLDGVDHLFSRTVIPVSAEPKRWNAGTLDRVDHLFSRAPVKQTDALDRVVHRSVPVPQRGAAGGPGPKRAQSKR